MWALEDIERLFNNQSVGAFLGALVAFFLVMFTDWRRNRRKARNIALELESTRFHAAQKRNSIIAVRDDLRNHNRLSPGRFIRFNTGLLLRLETDVLDQLNAEQRRALDAIVFRMESCDQLLDEAYGHARSLTDPRLQAGRTERVTELLDVFDDAIVDLGILIQMCDQYTQGKYAEVLTTLHERTQVEANHPAP